METVEQEETPHLPSNSGGRGFTARFCKGQLAEAEQMAEGMREGGGREVMISGPYSSVSPGLGKAGSVQPVPSSISSILSACHMEIFVQQCINNFQRTV